jgi:hypothetical protein
MVTCLTSVLKASELLPVKATGGDLRQRSKSRVAANAAFGSAERTAIVRELPENRYTRRFPAHWVRKE